MTAAAVAVAAVQAVSFMTSDGWTIAAAYRPAAKGKATVVLAHGVGSAGSEWARLTQALAAKGVGTLALDLRGHAGSRKGPPGATDFTGFRTRGSWLAATEDLRTAASWLRSKGVPDERIAFGGASIGANLASIVASERTSAAFLLLLSPAENYRGVTLKTRPGLRTLAVAAPSDAYAFAGVKKLEHDKSAAVLYARGGHGAQMFEDPATFKRIVAWTAAEPVSGYEVQILAQRSDVIWGFDFLPDGRILFTERKGRLALYDPKTREVSIISGAPAVWAHGQGGLLDVRVHPDFVKNGWVYLTWSQTVADGAATALGRGRLDEGALKDFERLFLSNAGGGNGEHFGSRLVFDGPHLYMSLGERGRRDLAQDLKRHNGKIVRLTHDGRPDGAGLPAALPEIWSWGHRNPQGLALRPGTKQLWSDEFGPRGGDELNLIKRGVNYGWPVITYGREYYGPKIGTTAKEGLAQPIAYWAPSISPSAMAFYDGDVFPHWRGSVFLACLSGRQLRRVPLTGNAPGKQEILLADRNWRFRNVRQGPGGLLYFSTDDGRLGRIAPAR